MKKALYMILLIAGFVVSFGLPALATIATGRAYFLIVAAVWVSVMVLLLANPRRGRNAQAQGRHRSVYAAPPLWPPLSDSFILCPWPTGNICLI